MRLATCPRRLLLFAVLGVLLAGRTAQAQVGTLSIEGTCPGEITARLAGGYSDHTYGLLFALREGTLQLPTGPCQGMVIGIRRGLRFVASFHTGGDGSGSLVGVAPPAACGGYLQAFAASICEPTNVVQIGF